MQKFKVKMYVVKKSNQQWGELQTLAKISLKISRKQMYKAVYVIDMFVNVIQNEKKFK